MSKKIKQISYLSAIIISIGSTIGAGIFFKNGEIFSNAGGSLGFMIASWVIAAIGILAIGLALVEVSSASKGDSGITGWVKKFMGGRTAKYSISYMLFVYLPLNYFALPLYAVMSLQDALKPLGVVFTGWETAAIGFAFFAWITIMGFFKFKTAEKMQWLFTILKFIPLIIIPLLAAADLGVNGGNPIPAGTATGLTGFSPWLGLMASIPAILFAMDGFYTVTSLKTSLKDEKKLGSVISVAISTIMGFYLFFAILTGTDGASGFGSISYIKNNEWIQITINIIIMFAVFGIVNGFAMSMPKMYHSLHKDGDTDVIQWVMKKFKIKSDELAAFVASISFALLFWIILTPVCIYAMDGTGSYPDYASTTANLFDMTDHIVNFTSLFVFIIIGISIFGAIKNRKTNKVTVKKSKFFLPSAWTATIFLTIGTIYMFVAAIVNMSGINNAPQTTEIVKFVILIITTFGTFIPTYWDKISPKLKSTFSRTK